MCRGCGSARIPPILSKSSSPDQHLCCRRRLGTAKFSFAQVEGQATEILSFSNGDGFVG